MNSKQRIVILLGIFVLFVNLMFPPWDYTFQTEGISRVAKPAGYALLFAPPQPRQVSARHGVALGTSRLVLQTVCILLLFGGLSFALPRIGPK